MHPRRQAQGKPRQAPARAGLAGPARATQPPSCELTSNYDGAQKRVSRTLIAGQASLSGIESMGDGVSMGTFNQSYAGGSAIAGCVSTFFLRPHLLQPIILCDPQQRLKMVHFERRFFT